MGAPALLQQLRNSGFDLDVAGDRLLVTPASRLTDADRADIRNFKVELLAMLTGQPPLTSDTVLTPATAGSTCTDCQHILPHGTCAEPVRAGLAETFGIRWAPEWHPANCVAFTSKQPAKPGSEGNGRH